MGHSHSKLRKERGKADNDMKTDSKVDKGNKALGNNNITILDPNVLSPEEISSLYTILSNLHASVSQVPPADSQADSQASNQTKSLDDSRDCTRLPVSDMSTVPVPPAPHLKPYMELMKDLKTPKNEDYFAPTEHDDKGIPFGRLRVLCPLGPVQQPLADKVVSSVLADISNTTKKNNKKAKTVMMKAPQNRNRRPNGPQSTQNRHKFKHSSSAFMSMRTDNDFGLDVLALRGLYNAACSPLLRLSDDLLVRIMGHLEWEDFVFLRYVSRTFMRLASCRPEFASLQDKDAITDNSSLFVLRMPWTTPALPKLDERLWINWKLRCQAISSREHQCGGCRHRAPGPTFLPPASGMYMHCTACHVDHPLGLFSGRQARLDKETADRRVCIAHEGRVRLCAHKTVDWATVLGSLPGGWLTQCDVTIRSPENPAPPFSVEADLRIVCDHPSHVKVNHRGNSNNDECEEENNKKNEDGADNNDPPQYTRFPADDGNNDNAELPSFIVHDMMVDGTKYKVATWSYTAHMDLSDISNDRPVTAQTFRDRLEKLREGHSPARYIALPDYPGILHELRCVDPERCGCLSYPGFKRRQDGPQPQMCQAHTAVRAFHSRVTNIDHLRIRLASCGHPQHPRCLQLVYTRTIRLAGFVYSIDAAWPPALRHGRQMQTRQRCLRTVDAFRNNTVVPLGWYQALDPQSYNVTDDPERQHLTWCRGTTCRHNPKFLGVHARPGATDLDLEMNVDCTRGCEATAEMGKDHTGRESRNSSHISISHHDHWGKDSPDS